MTRVALWIVAIVARLVIGGDALEGEAVDRIELMRAGVPGFAKA